MLSRIATNAEKNSSNFEEFCELRRATSEWEKRKFFWFFNNFLECVCGANIWRNAKTTQVILGAQESNGSKFVSVSDKAFGLLLNDNYLEKWKPWHRMWQRVLDQLNYNNTTTEAEKGSGQAKKKKVRRMAGKETQRNNARTVVGVESSSSMHCTRWLKKTGHFQRPANGKGVDAFLQDNCGKEKILVVIRMTS